MKDIGRGDILISKQKVYGSRRLYRVLFSDVHKKLMFQEIYNPRSRQDDSYISTNTLYSLSYY